MCLKELNETRSGLRHRISWASIFLKAFSTVSKRNPELLQTWHEWPTRHIFQHEEPCGTVAISREFRGEDWLFWGRFRSPQNSSLQELQTGLDRFATGRVEEVFRQQLQLSGLPWPVRRLAWWWNLNLAGAKRATRIGTFGMTSVAGRGAEIQNPPTLMSGELTYGPINKLGQCRVTVAYDHRLMDGAFIADRLMELEAELNDSIRKELSSPESMPLWKAA